MIDENIKKISPPDTIQKFIKVPKEIIMEQSLPEHRLSVLTYLNYNQTWDNMVHYSPLYLIQWSGYKPNWDRHNKNNIFVKFKSCMKWFSENEYIMDFEEKNFSQSNFQTSLLNTDKINPTSNFALLYDFEIKTIKNFKSSYKPLNNSILLLVLSYIRAFVWIRTNETSGHSKKSKQEKPEIFHSQFKLMENCTGISRKLISRAVDVLESFGIIKTYRMPKYKDNKGLWHTDDIVIVCLYKYVSGNGQIYKCSQKQYSYQEELDNGIEFLKNNRYQDKKFYQS